MATKKSSGVVVDELLADLVGKEVTVVTEGVQVKGTLDGFSSEVVVLKNVPTSTLAINQDGTLDIVFRNKITMITHNLK